MMFFRGHNCFYQLQQKKVAAGFPVIVACFLFVGARAQDTLILRSFPGQVLVSAPRSDFSVPKTASVSYPYLVNAGYTADTAAINARYLPSLNPRIAWRHTYPITREQMDERDRRLREENDIRRQIADEVVRSIFSRKKLKPVKPTF